MMPTGFLSLFSKWLKFSVLAVSLTLASAASAAFCYGQDEGDKSGEAIALFNQGQDSHEKGDLTEALKFYEKAIDLMPEFPEAELQKGNALFSLGRMGESEKAFRRAIELRDDWSLAQAGLGNILIRRGKYDEALPVLQRAIQLDAINFSAHAALSELLIKTNAKADQMRAELETIRQLCSKASPPASIWSARAALENALGDKAAAKTSLDRALAIDAKSSSALGLRAEISLSEGDIQIAEEFAARLEKTPAPRYEIKLLRSRILVQQGKNAEAVRILDSIEEKTDEVLKLSESIKAWSSEDPSALERQLENEPKNPAILGRLCTMLRVSDPQKALDYCRRASESDPGNIGYAVGYGAALVQATRYAEAVVLLNKLVSISPDNSTIHANLATALFQLKRYSEAKSEFRWLVERQPTLTGAYYFLAISHDQLGEYDDALTNYNIFLRIAVPESNKLEIEKVNLRLPAIEKLVKEKKGKRG